MTLLRNIPTYRERSWERAWDIQRRAKHPYVQGKKAKHLLDSLASNMLKLGNNPNSNGLSLFNELQDFSNPQNRKLLPLQATDQFPFTGEVAITQEFQIGGFICPSHIPPRPTIIISLSKIVALEILLHYVDCLQPARLHFWSSYVISTIPMTVLNFKRLPKELFDDPALPENQFLPGPPHLTTPSFTSAAFDAQCMSCQQKCESHPSLVSKYFC